MPLMNDDEESESIRSHKYVSNPSFFVPRCSVAGANSS